MLSGRRFRRCCQRRDAECAATPEFFESEQEWYLFMQRTHQIISGLQTTQTRPTKDNASTTWCRPICCGAQIEQQVSLAACAGLNHARTNMHIPQTNRHDVLEIRNHTTKLQTPDFLLMVGAHVSEELSDTVAARGQRNTAKKVLT